LSQRTARRGRNKVSRGGGRPKPAVEIKGDPAFFRRINYAAVGIGFLVASVIYLGVGYLAQNFLVNPADGPQASIRVYTSVSFLALFCGGLAAGMREPKYGVLNGPLVAVVFIMISVVLTLNSELQLVKSVGPLGLGPMRMDRVFATDLPQLFLASLGGLIAGLIEQRSVGRRGPAEAGGNGKKRPG
jgi:putative membrane protein (TIGR04086 family)